MARAEACRCASDSASHSAVLAYLPVNYVLVVHGHIFTGMGWRRSSIALGMPLAYVFAAMPISGLAMALFTIEVVYDDLRCLLTGRTVPHPQEDI
ncbi:hypothetical protein [Zobellella iuensis]|uniref:TRAP transporter small permease protein n=1 Tax=Zobellella iuensis TaxID=2803811 RepID=A0ABS1QN90_9GAMM|nr:hypothetical protein [Zobellella iuensis]MBL1376330.1 hypothetical protein [Zobellella iuensis]